MEANITKNVKNQNSLLSLVKEHNYHQKFILSEKNKTFSLKQRDLFGYTQIPFYQG